MIGTVTSDPRLRLYRCPDNYKAGRDVADFLLDKGHTSIAYFSPVHRALWSKERYRGICDAMLMHGIDKAATLYAHDWQGSFEMRESLMQTAKMRRARQLIAEAQNAVNAVFGAEDNTLSMSSDSHITRLYLQTIMQPLFTRAFTNDTITA